MRSSQLRATVAGEVRAALARRRLSQQQLADIIGLHRATLSDSLNCRRSFTLDELGGIAVALDVDLTSLFAGTSSCPTVTDMR